MVCFSEKIYKTFLLLKIDTLICYIEITLYVNVNLHTRCSFDLEELEILRN